MDCSPYTASYLPSRDPQWRDRDRDHRGHSWDVFVCSFVYSRHASPQSVVPVLCCCCLRKPLQVGKVLGGMRHGGSRRFENGCSKNLAMRILTDPPIGVVPLWLPTLPDGVGCAEHRSSPTGCPRGERFFPSPSQGVCCCRENACKGEDEDEVIKTLASRARVMLYFHGGASVCVRPARIDQ